MKKLLALLLGLLLAGCAGQARPTEDSLALEPAPALAGAPPNGGAAPAFSPDGRHIAFLSSTPHTPSDLWVMQADGSGARRLTTRGVVSYGWAEDGRSLRFTSRRTGLTEVFTVGLDGGQPQRLALLPVGASLPAYSPDGRLLAFSAPDGEGGRDLWVATADGAQIGAVTEKIGIRNFFWAPDSRLVFFEAGKSYGLGLWEIDLAASETRVLVNKYLGTPVYSAAAERIAFPCPVRPGEFEVRVVRPDGAGEENHPSPRLAGRSLSWDAAGKGVYYLGQDLAKRGETAAEPAEPAEGAHGQAEAGEFERTGVTSLWRLDFATGEERRVSPADLHLAGFSLSPDGSRIVLAGVLEKSHGTELFALDPASGVLAPLAASRPSAWMPLPSFDSARIAFFSNEGALDTLHVTTPEGEALADYPGFALQGDTRLFWLPENDGFLVFSGSGILGFSEKGPIAYKDKVEFRANLYAHVSLLEDKVLLSAVPRYGETPGLYMLEAEEGKFTVTDLRFPPPGSVGEEFPLRYLQPRWSFDGNRLAFTDGIDVWTMQSPGVGRKRLTSFFKTFEEESDRRATASFPVWSVAGDRLCFTLTVYEQTQVLRQIWAINADGSGEKMLYSEKVDSQFQIFLPEYTNQPFFDLTDERVIFTGIESGVPNLYAADVAGGLVERLTDSGAIYPALLPEEDLIVYTSLEGNDERLWMMNSHGTQKRPFEMRPAAKIKEDAVAGENEAAPPQEGPAGDAGGK